MNLFLPAFHVYDHADATVTYAVESGHACLNSAMTEFAYLPNRSDLLPCEPSHGICFSSLMRIISFPAFSKEITLIDHVISKKKMVGSATRWIVATVTYMDSFWNRTKVNHPRYAMSQKRPSHKRPLANPSVASSIASSNPFPASMLMLSYLGPEPLKDGGRKPLFGEKIFRSLVMHSVSVVDCLPRLRTVIRRAATSLLTQS